ncbi:MAG: 3-isopropylmalate dehydratase small subunit [Acidobacteria bacterium]|nr:3-isopropylmalate dehydratase small subunit [Acidobacteriota bacterium]
MKPFRKIKGLLAPLDRVNVDTDQIIPKQFLKELGRTGLGRGLFYDWRLRPDGSPDPTFVLNQERYRGASILLARANFGCGSSREHAPWALQDFGFQVILAPSFADIFYNNCFQNGILPAILPDSAVHELFRKVERSPGYTLEVDLLSETVADDEGWSVRFAVDPFRKKCLLEGLDDIGLTLQLEEKIRSYENLKL